MIRIPTDGKIIQANNSDKFGNISKTRNINFSKEGYIRQSPKTVSVMNEDDDADFNNTDALVVHSTAVMVVGSKIFEGDADLTTMTENAQTSAPSPGAEEGVDIFEEFKVVSSGTSALYAPISGGSWTSITSGLNNAYPTSIKSFPGKAGVMIGNRNKVFLYTTSSFTLSQTLTIPTDYIVTSLAANGPTAYIATRHTKNGEAQMFTWDGNGTSATGSYPVGSFEIPTIKSYDSSCVCVNSLGELLRFTGGGFKQLDAFPIYFSDYEWSDSGNDHSRISDLGMVVDGSIIYINIDARSSLRYPRRLEDKMLSGIWCYDPKVGLYHYSSPSQTTVFSETVPTTDINTTTDVVTVSAAPVTGTPFFYDKNASTTAAGGLKDDGVYYTIKVSSTTMKIAATYTDAIAGTAINLTSTGDGNQIFHFIEMKDFGWVYTENRQSVGVVKSSIMDINKAGRIVHTATLDVSGGKTSWNTFEVEFPQIPNRSYFETSTYYSDNVEQSANVIHAKYKPLNDDQQIIIKIKTEDKEGLPLCTPNISDTSSDWIGTWTDTDTFTTTVDLSDVSVGDEIEWLAGIGPLTAHVSSISESGGTYTVNIDETFPWAVANDTFYFKVDNWKKVKTVSKTNQTPVGYTTFSCKETGKFIKAKVELRNGVEIEEFIINDKVHKPITGV